MSRKIIVTIFLFIVVLISVAAIEPGKKKDEFSNLKVLPKDISAKALQKIMVDEYQDGLGVGCGYCHAPQKGSNRLDYASDEKPEKEIARAMMQMTMDINKKYFGVTNPIIGDSLLTVSCSVCHHGTVHPEKTD